MPNYDTKFLTMGHNLYHMKIGKVTVNETGKT